MSIAIVDNNAGSCKRFSGIFYFYGEIVKDKPAKNENKKPPEKHAGGRPPKYDPKYCKQLIEFFNCDAYEEKEITIVAKNGNEITRFEDVANDLPTFERFAVSIGIHRETLLNWTEKYPEFFDAYKAAKDYQKDMLITNALKGLYNPVFSIFTAKNITDMRDKQVVEHEGLGSFISQFNSKSEKI